MRFDKILTLNEGRIVEYGTHAELEKDGGYYNRLLDEHTTHSESEQ